MPIATEATLAAGVAKLSADPATQTTLAAVLAKLSGDPATQTTLAAILSALQGNIKTAPQSALALPAGTAIVGAVGIGAVPASQNAYGTTTVAGANSANIKATAGNLFELCISNPTATATYVKVYNKATAPTVGTDTPWAIIPAAANSFQVVNFGANGKRLSNGIGLGTSGAIAVTDTTAGVAGVVITGTWI